MNLLIHDLNETEWNRIAADYKDWTVISDTGQIRPCTGCFSCWTMGSGKCVIKDGYERMGELIHNADEVHVMSRYTYGGFSSFVKNVFDRSLGYVLPEFETAYGEMHHKKRYAEDKPVSFYFRGRDLSQKDKEKVIRYVHAVCRNLRGHVKEVTFEECHFKEISKLQNRKEEKRSGILLLDCSLRGNRSNTNVFLKKLQSYLKGPSSLISLSSLSNLTEIIDACRKAETIVLGVPLYVDGIPASALRIMETLKRYNACDQSRIYAVVNNGLYESRQNESLIRMIRDWCKDTGIQYQGALAIGAGELTGTLMRADQHPLWPVNNALKGLKRMAEMIQTGRKTETCFADPYLFPRALYIQIANLSWQKQKLAIRIRNRKK